MNAIGTRSRCRCGDGDGRTVRSAHRDHPRGGLHRVRERAAELARLYASGLNHAGNDFYVYQDERYTYQTCGTGAAQCANALQGRGVEPGDRVGIALRNYPEWIAAFMGITATGAVAVAVNAWWSREELLYGIEDSGLKILFTDVERTERLLPHRDQLAIEIITVRHARPGLTTWEQFIDNAATTMPEPDIAPEELRHDPVHVPALLRTPRACCPLTGRSRTPFLGWNAAAPSRCR